MSRAARLEKSGRGCYMPREPEFSRKGAAERPMQNVLIIIHLLVVLALVGVVLLQRSEGGGLGLGGGSSGVSGFLTGRGQANALTRATTVLAAAFFLTSILLTMLQTYGKKPVSILDTAPAGVTSPAPGQPAAPASAPAQGQTVLDQLKQLQNNNASPPAGQPAPANGPQVPLPQ
jgi:preprotein translocase subunit SecG